MMTAKKLCSLQYSGAEWCITSNPSHTMYTLLKSKPFPIATICGCMKVPISASTEALISLSKKQKRTTSTSCPH